MTQDIRDAWERAIARAKYKKAWHSVCQMQEDGPRENINYDALYPVTTYGLLAGGQGTPCSS